MDEVCEEHHRGSDSAAQLNSMLCSPKQQARVAKLLAILHSHGRAPKAGCYAIAVVLLDGMLRIYAVDK